MRPSIVRRVALASLTFAACKKTPPPVDFQSRADASVARDVASVDGGAFRAREGSAVPGDGRSLTFAGRTATAPAGQRFTEAMPWDYDRDGRDDALFVARVTDGGDVGGVSLVRAHPDTLEVTNIIGPEPEDPSCGAAHFRQTSPRSLVLTWSCPTERPAAADGGPRGRFTFEAVLMGPIGNDTGFRARMGIMRGGHADTAVRLAVEGTDLDGDGRDEMVVQVSAGRPGADPSARARLVYFDRDPAWALDTSEPAATIRPQIDALRRRASNRRLAASVPGAVDDLLRLRRALCHDEAVLRVKLPGALGLRCAPELFAGASEALLRAYVTLGELPAAWALTREATAHPLGVVPFERVRATLEGASTPERGATATLGPVLLFPFEAMPALHLPLVRWEDPRAPDVFALRGERPARMSARSWAPLTDPAPTPEPVTAVIPTDLARSRRLAGLAWTVRGLTAVLCAPDDVACADAWRARPGAVPPTAQRGEIPIPPASDVPPEEAAVNYASAYRGDDLRVLGWGAEGLVLALRGRVWRLPSSGEAVALAANTRWTGAFPEGQSITEDGRVAALAAPEGVWVHENTAWRRLLPDALRPRLGDVREVVPSADGRTLLARLADNSVALIQRAPPRR